MSAAWTKSQVPETSSSERSATSPSSSYEARTTRCGDSTTSAGTEGPESSARRRGPSSDPWFAHTMRGRIRRREGSWALPTRSDLDFSKEEYGLRAVRVDTWGGFVWASLDDAGPTLGEEMGEFFARFPRFDFEGLGLGARRTYEVEANWKILGENYSECYHCAPIHH